MSSSPAGLLGLSGLSGAGGKTRPPITLRPCTVKHALTLPILAATTRNATGTTSVDSRTHALACSMRLTLVGPRWNRNGHRKR